MMIRLKVRLAHLLIDGYTEFERLCTFVVDPDGREL